VKPAPFRYLAAASADEAVSLLAEHGDEAKIMAGGQSLVPLMNLRLARPAVVVDVSRVAGLAGVTNRAGLCLGATTRQAHALADGDVGVGARLLVEALRHVAHPAIRARGTLGGSLAHADPAAELPAVLVALDAEIVARSTRGERTIAAADFVTGPFTTALAPDELLTEIRIPAGAGRRRHGFDELARRAGDFALAGSCCTASVAGGKISDARVVLFGVGPSPVRARDAEAALEGASPADGDALSAAAEGAAAACDPNSDVHGSASYRRRVAAVVTRRALERLGGGSG
jgi:carbon-monoxide dehydrogenase medium subunit